MQNPYEKKKQRGVRGEVPRNFKSIKIFDKTGESIVLFVGKLDENAYDCGFEIYFSDGSHLRKLPGVGGKWFKEEKDAEAYAAYAIKIAFSQKLSQGAYAMLMDHIKNLTMPKLDLL